MHLNCTWSTHTMLYSLVRQMRRYRVLPATNMDPTHTSHPYFYSMFFFSLLVGAQIHPNPHTLIFTTFLSSFFVCLQRKSLIRWCRLLPVCSSTFKICFSGSPRYAIYIEREREKVMYGCAIVCACVRVCVVF